MLKAVLNQVVGGENLSRQEAQESMQAIMTGQASESQIGGLLTALRIKGETSEEIAGFAETMRNHTVKVECRQSDLLDTCGTGGDRKGTFNISTTVAIVVAGAGASVAKHGNHGVSSSSGSADVLKALGVRIDLPAQNIASVIEDARIAFLYAPTFHPAMKYAGKPRRELGFRTVFNVLGPLTNPLAAERQLMGVYEQSLTKKLAEVLLRLNTRRAMVVHGLDGLDEISTTAPTQVSEVVDGKILSYLIDPAEYGLPIAALEDISGGTPEQNADIVLGILSGKQGARRDLVLLNAAAALVVADKAENIREGMILAAKSIDSGAAQAKLERMRELTRQSA